jgi:hypothetical protein
MNLFDSFGKHNSETDSALAKQKAVNDLWKIQASTVEIINRGCHSECLTDAQAQAWIQELNGIRQVIQDSFLLCHSLQLVQDKASAAISEFTHKAEGYKSEVVSLERNMDIEERVQNMIKRFIEQFESLAQRQRMDGRTKEYLRSEVEMYANSLKRNISDHSMRPSVKKQLLHELVDDFFIEVSQVYREATLPRGRI